MRRPGRSGQSPCAWACSVAAPEKCGACSLGKMKWARCDEAVQGAAAAARPSPRRSGPFHCDPALPSGSPALPTPTDGVDPIPQQLKANEKHNAVERARVALLEDHKGVLEVGGARQQETVRQACATSAKAWHRVNHGTARHGTARQGKARSSKPYLQRQERRAQRRWTGPCTWFHKCRPGCFQRQ